MHGDVALFESHPEGEIHIIPWQTNSLDKQCFRVIGSHKSLEGFVVVVIVVIVVVVVFIPFSFAGRFKGPIVYMHTLEAFSKLVLVCVLYS